MKVKFIIILVLLLMLISYRFGKNDGCYDLVNRLNSFGYNRAKEGVGLDGYSWCTIKNDQRTK